MSKFADLPLQRYEVYRYVRGKIEITWWQRRLMVRKARGVWMPVCSVSAHSPWEACRQARKDYPQAMRHAMKLRAMPTWERVAQPQLKLASA